MALLTVFTRFIWLASLNWCWTADRLARRGLDHPDQCSLCDQEDKTVQHLLVSCVFSRDIWYQVLSLVGLQRFTPRHNDEVFQNWWRTVETRVPKQQRAGFNSLVILLVAWWMWKHRNACVFYGTSPSTQRTIQDIKDEATMWCMAGARGLIGICP